MRDTVLLGVACAGGVVICPQLPYVGLPVVAAAAAGLGYRGRAAAGVVAVALGVVVVASVMPTAAIFAAPAAAMVLLSIRLLRRHSAQLTAAVLTLAFAASALAADVVSARLLGESLTESLRADTVAITERLTQALGAGGAGLADQLAGVREVIVALWPAFYVQSAIVGAVLVVAAIAWAAGRSGEDVAVPTVRELDLSVHVLWLLVVGLVALAATAVAGLGDYEQAVRAVGLNALYIARALFFLQGIAVFSALFDVPRTGYGKMVALFIVLYMVDLVLLVVSLAGMLDFWANFRRLPRDGTGKPALVEESPGRYLE